MCNIRFQVPTLARKCDISHWLPCGADGRAGGHVTIRISLMDRYTYYLSCGGSAHARVELHYNLAFIAGGSEITA